MWRDRAASALKMTYAAYTKGTSALVAAILSVARREGVLTALLEEWRASQPLLLEGHERQLQGAAPKAWRWAGEMEEIAPRSRPPGCRGASTAPRPTSTVASRTTATQTARRPRTSSPPCWATESPSAAQPGPALPCPALRLPCPALPCPALPCCPAPALLCPALPCPALLCPALPCAALLCPALPCAALRCPALPCAALLCPALPCAALRCPALPCAALERRARGQRHARSRPECGDFVVFGRVRIDGAMPRLSVGAAQRGRCASKRR